EPTGKVAGAGAAPIEGDIGFPVAVVVADDTRVVARLTQHRGQLRGVGASEHMEGGRASWGGPPGGMIVPSVAIVVGRDVEVGRDSPDSGDLRRDAWATRPATPENGGAQHLHLRP